MAQIVFAGGETLTVTEQLGEVLGRLTRAVDGEAISVNTEQGHLSVTGWAIFSPQGYSEPVYVLPGSVAYVRDTPGGSAQFH